MSNFSSKSSKSSEKKRIRFNKKTSIIVMAIIAVILILGAVFGFVSLDKGELGIIDYNAYIKNIKLGLDLKGGVYAVYTAEKPDGSEISDEQFKAAIDGTAKRLQDLLFSKGFPEALVSLDGNQIRVEVPDVEDQDEIFDLIGRPASLEMYEVNVDQQGKITKVDENAKPYIIGTDIETASVGMQDGKYVIQLKFTSEGTKKFTEATSALNGKYLGIFVNKEPLMAPKVNTTINNGQAIIEGDYTYEQAYQYAVSIQSGALGVKLILLESDTISASLGRNAIQHGLIAGGVGLLLIMIFMIWRYRLLGVVASISLFFFSITYLFFLSIFPWVQLTLPGIAGILLSIGMAVDANVIIFERIKEEREKGKSLMSSIDVGFSKSYSAILDGNVTTLIGAVVLIILAAASIKGFAITLLIGIIISLVSSLIFSRILLKAFITFNDDSDKLYGTHIGEVDYSIDYDNDKESATEVQE